MSDGEWGFYTTLVFTQEFFILHYQYAIKTLTNKFLTLIADEEYWNLSLTSTALNQQIIYKDDIWYLLGHPVVTQILIQGIKAVFFFLLFKNILALVGFV